jgi:hypothetical protein
MNEQTTTACQDEGWWDDEIAYNFKTYEMNNSVGVQGT